MNRAQSLALEISKGLGLSKPQALVNAEVALIAGKLAPLFEALEYALAGPSPAINRECKLLAYIPQEKGHHCASCWIDEVRRLAGQALSEDVR